MVGASQCISKIMRMRALFVVLFEEEEGCSAKN